MLEEDIYKTIDVAGEGIYSEKRSKFLAFAIPVLTVEDVKRVADLIAPTNDEDGVARVIDQYFLV